MIILLAAKQTRSTGTLAVSRSTSAAGGVALDATNVVAIRNRMRGAHFVLGVAVLVCRTVNGRVDNPTRTCCWVGNPAILALARAAGRGVGIFDARIAEAHDGSGMDDETVFATGGIAEVFGIVSAFIFDAAARLAS